MAARKATPMSTVADATTRATLVLGGFALYLPRDASPRKVAVRLNDMGYPVLSATNVSFAGGVAEFLRTDNSIQLLDEESQGWKSSDYVLKVNTEWGRTPLRFTGTKVTNGMREKWSGGTWDQFVEWAASQAAPDYKSLEAKLVKFHYKSSTHPAGEDRKVYVEAIEGGLIKGIDADTMEHRSFRIDRVIGDILVAPHTKGAAA